ncbi:MAG: MotA/TolQ/ExbB proton channel family protein [Bacteroidota bacterium]
MKNLFFMGGPLFMGILTFLLVVMTVWIVYHTIKGYTSQQVQQEKALRQLKYGKSIGLFAMVTGIFGQLIGFYEAFTAIEQAGDISPALVYGGIKVSMITTLYGITIYLFSLLLWFIASQLVERR